MFSPSEQFEDAMEVERRSQPTAVSRRGSLNETMGNERSMSHGDSLMEKMNTNVNVPFKKKNGKALTGPPLDPSLPLHDETSQSKSSSSQPLVESKERNHHDKDGNDCDGNKGSLSHGYSLEKRSGSNVNVYAVKKNGAPHESPTGQFENVVDEPRPPTVSRGSQGKTLQSKSQSTQSSIKSGARNHDIENGIDRHRNEEILSHEDSSREPTDTIANTLAKKIEGLPYEALTDNDVRCGKIVRKGNEKFHALVQGYSCEYAQAKKKNGVAQKVVRDIHAAGGRFLSKDEKSGLWYPLSEKQATKKASEALRRRGVHKPNISDSELTADDVLCVRGRYGGSSKFKALVRVQSSAFARAESKAVKTGLARKIVEAVKAEGRFLEKDKATGLWFEISDEKAYAKAQYALENFRCFSDETAGVAPDQVTDSDVLGEVRTQHPGLLNYYALVREHRGEFASVDDAGKRRIARDIISTVKSAPSNGRFLAKKNGSELWFELDDKATQKKVLCALRKSHAAQKEVIGPRTRVSTEDITDRDIKCGHTGKASGSKKWFNALVDAQLRNFVQAKTANKTVVVRKVVDLVLLRGRFLSKDPHSDSWIELTRDEAVKSTRRVFYRRSKQANGGTVPLEPSSATMPSISSAMRSHAPVASNAYSRPKESNYVNVNASSAASKKVTQHATVTMAHETRKRKAEQQGHSSKRRARIPQDRIDSSTPAKLAPNAADRPAGLSKTQQHKKPLCPSTHQQRVASIPRHDNFFVGIVLWRRKNLREHETNHGPRCDYVDGRVLVQK